MQVIQSRYTTLNTAGNRVEEGTMFACFFVFLCDPYGGKKKK